MSARFVWTGFEEMKADLRALPKNLADDAVAIARAKATAAADDMRAVYEAHAISHHLAKGLSVVQLAAGPLGVAFQVRNSDPIAWLFDNGSQARHWMGGKSTGTMWGKTPPTHVFVQTMIRRRYEMFDVDFRALLVRNGLQVTGDV